MQTCSRLSAGGKAKNKIWPLKLCQHFIYQVSPKHDYTVYDAGLHGYVCLWTYFTCDCI